MTYIIKFLFQPLRFCWLMWRKITGRGLIVIIYMKSGNVIKTDMKGIEWKSTDSQITDITWYTANIPHKRLKHINVEQIEAIVVIN